MHLKKQPNRVFRRAWGSLIKKASNRSLCTEDDNSLDGQDHPSVDEKTQFRRAPNSSWLAGPLAGATQVYKRGPRTRDATVTIAESQSAVDVVEC